MFSFLKKKESSCCEVEIIEVKENQACCDEVVETEDCCSESQKEKESCC